MVHTRAARWARILIALALIAGLPTGFAEVQSAAARAADGSSALADAEAADPGDLPPRIAAAMTALPDRIAEPGGTVVFRVTVENTTTKAVTLTSLTDDVFGDLLDGANPLVGDNDCDDQATDLAVGAIFSCSFEAVLAGDAGDPDHVNTVTAVVRGGGGHAIDDRATESVRFTDVMPSISVNKTPSVGSLPEPGGPVVFAVEVINTSVEPVTLTSLSDDVFGDLLDPANPAIGENDCDEQPVLIGVGGTLACSFTAELSGLAGDPDHVDTVTATAEDDEQNQAAADDDAVVAFTDVRPSISVTKTPSVESVPEPGGPVTFTIEVVNTSVEPVTLIDLGDNVFGDLLDPANPAIGENDCDEQPALIAVGGTLTCSFDGEVLGAFGDPDHASVAVATVDDGDGNRTQAYDEATVAFTEAEVGPALLSGSVWVELDGDRVQTVPEPPLGGVTIDLLDGDGNPVDTATTAADGTYGFADLVAGDYTLEIDESTVPDGYLLAKDPDGDASGAATVALAAHQVLSGQDFVQVGTGSIGDLVWLDEDADGVHDFDEDPLSNITVELTFAGGDGVFGTDDDWEFRSQVTGTDGSYRFAELPPGTYRVSVDLDTVGQGMSATTATDHTVTLAPGEGYDDGDVGFAPGDETLPATGTQTDRLGLAAVTFLIGGVALLLIGREVDRRRQWVERLRGFSS